MLRIPGSINSKYNKKVTIVQKWNRDRVPISRELMEDFRTYLEQKVTDQENYNNYYNRYRYRNHSNRYSNNNNNRIEWIEKILLYPIEDCRKIIVDLILAPYLINIKKISYDESYQKIREWLGKCNDIMKLDNYTNFVNYRIHFALKNAIHKGIGPMSQEKIKKDDKYKKLYTLLFKDK